MKNKSITPNTDFGCVELSAEIMKKVSRVSVILEAAEYIVMPMISLYGLHLTLKRGHSYAVSPSLT